MKIIHVKLIPTFRIINHQKTIYLGFGGLLSPVLGSLFFHPNFQTEAWYRTDFFSNIHQ